MREVIQLDLEKLDTRSGLVGLFALTTSLVAAAVLGPEWIAAGIAALFVVAGSAGDRSSSSGEQTAFVLFGGATTLVVGVVASSPIAASLAIGVIAFGTTLLALRGPVAAASGAYLLIWAVLTVGMVDAESTPAEMAVAFLAGGAVAVGGLWLAHRVDPEQGGVAAPTGMDRRALLVFALVRAIGAGLCTALGYWLFPEHVAWAALAFVLVLRPPKQQAIQVGVGRTVGTVAGVLLGMAIAALVGDSEAALFASFGLCSFAMLATTGVNYAVSTTFTTALLLIAQRLIEDDVFATGFERVMATLCGILVSFAVLTALRTEGAENNGK